MQNSNDVNASYAPLFKGWSKLAGSKPTTEMLETAHAFGKPGKQSLALAMAMRDEGVTGQQISLICSNPQNNHRRGLIEAALLKRVNMPKTSAGHTVYKVEVTAKGKQRIERQVANAAKLAAEGATVKAPKVRRVKGKASKPRKPAVTPVDVIPQGDTPQADTQAQA